MALDSDRVVGIFVHSSGQTLQRTTEEQSWVVAAQCHSLLVLWLLLNLERVVEGEAWRKELLLGASLSPPLL